MNHLISILIFFTSTAYIAGKSFGEVQLTVFKILVPIIFLLSLTMKPKRNVINKWFVATIGGVFASVLFLKGMPLNVALEPLAYLFLGLLLYISIANHLTDIKPVLNGICWAVGMQAVIVTLQGLGLDP